ncbi:MAG TPA: glycosyltransferase, partial [Saprospiraceae bacterium]|nr:glycosyltransferase [Saprospiraceae bacterium]
LIPVKNGSKQLEKNLPTLAQQAYPSFEIIVIDDHSDQEENRKLNEFILRFPNVMLISSDLPPGKMNAITVGLKKSKYECILLADADGQPASPKWIETMTASAQGNGIVLGYSPYKKVKGLLNMFIRFETIMTGMQYLSWAMRGRPYMGVGRNLLISRTLLQEQLLKNIQDAPYGHDDYLVQALSHKTQVSTCIDPDGFVYTEAPSTWSAWMNQKHRHLSAARSYSFRNWWKPGLFGIALVLHWLLLVPVLGLKGHPITWSLTMIALSIRWIRYVRWAARLEDRDMIVFYPVLEFAYAVYLAFMGTWTVIKKKQSWN